MERYAEQFIAERSREPHHRGGRKALMRLRLMQIKWRNCGDVRLLMVQNEAWAAAIGSPEPNSVASIAGPGMDL
jgi:hypothetical protein